MKAPSVGATFLKITGVALVFVVIGSMLIGAGVPGHPLVIPAVFVVIPIFRRDRELRRLAATPDDPSEPFEGLMLPADRVAVSRRPFQFTFEPATRKVYSPGALHLSATRVRFDAVRAGRGWAPAGGPTSIELVAMRVPRVTTVRVSCGTDVGQFVIERKAADLRDQIASYVPAALIATA